MGSTEPRAMIFNIQKFSLHDGPGIRTSVFFKGCSLRCGWCANPESQEGGAEILAEPSGPKTCGRIYTVGELMQEILKDRVFYETSGGGVTLTGGEPFLQPEFASSLCGELRKQKIHIAAETAGNVGEEVFAALAGQIDFIYMDIKHYDPERHREGTGSGNAQILRNLDWLAVNHPDYTVRIPLIPGYNDSAEDAERFGRLFAEKGIRTVQIMPFHRLGEMKYRDSGRTYRYAGVRPPEPAEAEAFGKILAEAGVKTI